MKLSVLTFSLALSYVLVSAQDCGNQKCYRYLNGKKYGDAKAVKSDCLSFLEATTTLPGTTTSTLPITTTTTVYETTAAAGFALTKHAIAQNVDFFAAAHKTLPAYASHSCYEPLATSKYTSACNCLGYFPTTITEYLNTETSALFTVTTTLSVPSTSCIATVTTTEYEAGPGHNATSIITNTATETSYVGNVTSTITSTVFAGNLTKTITKTSTETLTSTIHHSMNHSTATITSTLISTLPGNFSYITLTSFIPITSTEIATSTLLSTSTEILTSTLTTTSISSCPTPEPTGCAPQYCGGYDTPCGPGGSCICVTTTEGGSFGFCGEGSSYCSGLTTCQATSECEAGYVCAVGTCCDVNVCLPPGTCLGYGGANVFDREETRTLRHRKVYADTVGIKAGRGVRARAVKLEIA